MSAKFKVIHAGPFVGVQDAGRFNAMRFGVTPSGPMDRRAFQIANHALGRESGAPVIEIALGGLTIECIDGSVTACVTGGDFSIKLNDVDQPPWSAFTLHPGSVLKIRSGNWGSWCYLAFSGDLQTPRWLGSQSVHLNSGLCGNQFVQGDIINLANPVVSEAREGALLDPIQVKPKPEIRVVMGPQDRFFTNTALDDLVSKPFSLTSEYNRMGVRLSGPKLEIDADLTMPSAPISRGSLQVPGHGDPICLLADHQTTGGYPKIATVISADLDQISQLRVGDSVKFSKIDAMEAVHVARTYQSHIENLKEQVTDNQRGMAYKLLNNNLISGVNGPDE